MITGTASTSKPRIGTEWTLRSSKFRSRHEKLCVTVAFSTFDSQPGGSDDEEFQRYSAGKQRSARDEIPLVENSVNSRSGASSRRWSVASNGKQGARTGEQWTGEINDTGAGDFTDWRQRERDSSSNRYRPDMGGPQVPRMQQGTYSSSMSEEDMDDAMRWV